MDVYKSEDNRDILYEVEHYERNSELEEEAPHFQQPASMWRVSTSGSNFACVNWVSKISEK